MSRQHYYLNLSSAFAIACVLFQGVASGRVEAQEVLSPSPNLTGSLCTMKVQVPPPAPPTGQVAGANAAQGAAAAPAPAGAPPRLVKVTDDVYVIQNSENTFAQIGQFGGNVTIYITDDGVILFDSKNDRMYNDIVAKVRSLTRKPIKYVVLTHNHRDHSGGAEKMLAAGATVISSIETQQHMQKANLPGLPRLTYHGTMNLVLGGKEVRLREFCGHTDGDTVAYLPGPRVIITGDLVTTPDAIPQIVNFGDGGTWTDMGNTLDEIANMDFDFLVGGHGPVLTTREFMTHRDRVSAIRERLRELNREGKSQEEITQTLLKEYNYGTGPGAAQIPLMMQELKGPRTPNAPER